RYEEEIQRRAAPTVAHQVGVFISLVRPKIPRNWLANVLYSSPYANHQELLGRLPPEVCSAAEAYLATRQQLLQLSASGAMAIASTAAIDATPSGDSTDAIDATATVESPQASDDAAETYEADEHAVEAPAER